MRVALKFAYNGMNFSGYARQPNQSTVEGLLLDTCIENHLIRDAQEACFRTASRTDAGVSALGNVCAFNTTTSLHEILKKASPCSSDIFIYGVQAVPLDFYPRYAQRREYRYYLKRHDLDFDAMLSAAALFTGEHNFQNFAKIDEGKNPMRTIDTIVFSVQKDFFVIDFYAQTFLWNQIRRIVSALEKVGKGSLTQQHIKDALDHPGKKVDYQVAAAEFLLLKDVVYDFSFLFQEGYKKTLHRFEHNIISSLS